VTAGCLFVALKGERFDAHDFAEQAKERRRRAAGQPSAGCDLPQVVVKDTRLAFGELAAWVRQQVPARVVALTGSSGKTSVKEMTAAILSQCGNTLYTAGNLNNDIGVPMTLLRLTKEHQYAVIELGANHQGEIAWTVPDAPGSGAGEQPGRRAPGRLWLAGGRGESEGRNLHRSAGKRHRHYECRQQRLAELAKRDWRSQSLALLAECGQQRFTATNVHVTSTALNLRCRPQRAALMYCCRCRVAITSPMRWPPRRWRWRWAPHEAMKAGLAHLKAVPGRLFPIQLGKPAAAG
jgi:UDP-N-acetylmuramoyl-tripeptide--D-alanyl-D-alanine ligase